MESGHADHWPPLQKFASVQDILDHNKILIAEINHNHEIKTTEALARNALLIAELNGNLEKVVQLYAELSATVSQATVADMALPLNGSTA